MIALKIQKPFHSPNQINDSRTRTCVQDLAECGENHARHLKSLLEKVGELESRFEELETRIEELEE